MSHHDKTSIGMDLDNAMARLPSSVSLCVTLSYHARMTHDEIAKITGIQLGTVKSHIRRGSKRLREMLSAELEAEAARLKSEADTALQTIDQFSEATFRRDDLMSQRKRVLAERADLLAVRHGRHEQMARDAAVARSLADSRGWFGFPSIAPGTYALYARLTKKGMDLEWFEPVTIAGSDVQVELDETSVRGLLPDQQGKR